MPEQPAPAPNQARVLPIETVCHARVLPTRSALVSLLPKGAIFAEIGVGFGVFTQEVFDGCQPSTYIAIDNFRLHENTSLWGTTPERLFEGLTHEAYYRRRFSAALAAGILDVRRGDSAECIAQLDDESVDVMYLDAGHEYHEIKRDLAAAHGKVKPDGWLIINDYVLVGGLGEHTLYGVVQATNEFLCEHDWGMQYFVLQPQMFCDVALRRSACLGAGPDPTSALVLEGQRLRGELDTCQAAAIAASRRHEGEAAALRREIDVIRASRSWRYTAPLRRLAKTLRPGG